MTADDKDRLAEIEARFQTALDTVPPGAIYTDPCTGETHNVTKPYTHTNLTRLEVIYLITHLKETVTELSIVREQAKARIAEMEAGLKGAYAVAQEAHTKMLAAGRAMYEMVDERDVLKARIAELEATMKEYGL